MSKLLVVVVAGLLLCGISGYAIAQSGSGTPKTIKACPTTARMASTGRPAPPAQG